MKSNKWQRCKVLLVLFVACSLPVQGIAQCIIADQMTQMQSDARDRQLEGLDRRFEAIVKMNDLQRKCLDAFPAYPTDIKNTALLNQAFKQFKNVACKTLTGKITDAQRDAVNRVAEVRRDYESRAADAYGNATGGIDPGVMREIQTQTQSVVTGNSTVTDAVKNGATNVGTEKASDTMMDKMRRMFQ